MPKIHTVDAKNRMTGLRDGGCGRLPQSDAGLSDVDHSQHPGPYFPVGSCEIASGCSRLSRS